MQFLHVEARVAFSAMFHVYRLGRDGCQALVEDFDRFRSDSASVEDELYRYATMCEERWSAFSEVEAQSPEAKDWKLLSSAYKSSMFLVFFLSRIHISSLILACPCLTDKIYKTNPSYVKKSAVSTLAQILCVHAEKICVRDRENWATRLQLNDAKMLPKGKTEYHWEELNVHVENEPTPKPGTLNEEILFPGEEQAVYQKSLTVLQQQPNWGPMTLADKAKELQRSSMRAGPYVGKHFQLKSATHFLQSLTKKKRKKRKPSPCPNATEEPPRRRNRDSFENMYIEKVEAKVQLGMPRQDAEAAVIRDLVHTSEHPRDVVRVVVANELNADGETIIQEAAKARVECFTDDVQENLENITTRGAFSDDVYRKSVRPMMKKLATSLNPAGAEPICSGHKLTSIRKERWSRSRARFFTPADTPRDAPSCLIVDEVWASGLGLRFICAWDVSSVSEWDVCLRGRV